jgi:hypothetical protein
MPLQKIKKDYVKFQFSGIFNKSMVASPIQGRMLCR